MVSANTSGLTSDYNDIYVSGAGGVFGNNGSDQATLALWKTATGQDAHSISTAPGFVDAATDLHLTASPSTANFLINNQGIPVATVTADIDGDTRNLYTPDPGFDEFKGTGSWIGVTSTAWATSSNWDDNIIPTSSLDAKILNAPNMPLVTTNPESVHDLYITLPGTLTVNGGNLRIAGNIYNNATFDASAGSIEMNGTLLRAYQPVLLSVMLFMILLSVIPVLPELPLGGVGYLWLSDVFGYRHEINYQ